MQNGLAMQADQRDAFARDGEALEERLDRRDMSVRHVALELGCGASASSGSAMTARSRCATASG